MQVTHPEEENYAIFHAIDSNRNGMGTTFYLLPSAATHGQSIIQNLLPFLKWMLALTVEPDQIAKIVKQFQPEAVTKQNHLLWDMEISKAQQDYPAYNLTAQTSKPPTVVTTATVQNPPTSMGGLTQIHQPTRPIPTVYQIQTYPKVCGLQPRPPNSKH